MIRNRSWRRVGLGALAALALVVAVGCGGEDGQRSNASNPPAAGGETSTSITSIATDNKFDQGAYAVKAGQSITLTLENKGQALHNWRLAGAKGKDGKAITTQLLPGGKSEVITFAVDQAGTYDFICDVHPVEMKGKLTVS